MLPPDDPPDGTWVKDCGVKGSSFRDWLLADWQIEVLYIRSFRV